MKNKVRESVDFSSGAFENVTDESDAAHAFVALILHKSAGSRQHQLQYLFKVPNQSFLW